MPFNNLRTGTRVKVGDKEGNIRELGDKYKIKFDDGSFGFYSPNEITPIIDDSRLKNSTKFERLKAESRLTEGTIFMSPEPSMTDVFAQPKRKTGRGPGDKAQTLPY